MSLDEAISSGELSSEQSQNLVEELDLLDKVPHYVPISAKDEWNFDELMEKIG